MTIEKLQHCLDGIESNYLVIEYYGPASRNFRKEISVQKCGHQVTFPKKYLEDDRFDIVVRCLQVLDENIERYSWRLT
jgi:hypothetical protein